MTARWKAIVATRWYVGGDNAGAECLQRDECDWEVLTLTDVRNATRQAEDHALATGHPVMVERAQFRVINPDPSWSHIPLPSDR